MRKTGEQGDHIVAVIGPTGSGKSELALDIAARWPGEIVNCDSVQVYRGLEIGAAKLSIPARRGIPHHLIDVAGPESEFTAGDYSRLARHTLSKISLAGKLPVICGGTGFYLRALLDGLSPAPPRCERLRESLARIARRRPSSLHRMLARLDPAAAARIHVNDHQKLIRALELCWLGRTTASSIQSRPRSGLQGYRVLKLALSPDRRLLHAALNERSAQMFRNGLIDETKRLLECGYAVDSKPMQSLGYRQAIDVITGAKSLDAAITECQVKTRQYAKRQTTWFRAEADVNWLHGFGAEPHIREQAFHLVDEFLRGNAVDGNSNHS